MANVSGEMPLGLMCKPERGSKKEQKKCQDQLTYLSTTRFAAWAQYHLPLSGSNVMVQATGHFNLRLLVAS